MLVLSRRILVCVLFCLALQEEPSTNDRRLLRFTTGDESQETTVSSTSSGSRRLETFCGCESCTSQVLDALACDPYSGCHPCRARIEWLQSAGGGALPEQQACVTVSSEFPNVCRACDPHHCDAVEQPQCRVVNATDDTNTNLLAAIDWVCGPDNTYVPMNCQELYANAGLANSSSAVEKANVVFDAYWNGAHRVDGSCCFGTANGRNGIARVTAETPTRMPEHTHDSTSSPTRLPTFLPTSSPTKSPTKLPTTEPTVALNTDCG